MSFTDAIQMCFRKYVTFSGRAARSEFWYFMLFISVGSLISGLAGTALNAISGRAFKPDFLTNIFQAATLLPASAAVLRRLHDTGRSHVSVILLMLILAIISIISFAVFSIGPETFDPATGVVAHSNFSFFVLTLPIIAAVFALCVLLWWLSRPSQPGSNRYGPGPQEVSS